MWGTHKEEGEVEVGEGCPGEEQLDSVVNELELQDPLAEKALARGPDAEHIDGGMESGKERAVKPTTTLRDELRDGGGHVGRGLRGLDVL